MIFESSNLKVWVIHTLPRPDPWNYVSIRATSTLGSGDTPGVPDCTMDAGSKAAVLGFHVTTFLMGLAY